tara:strand:+ start:405 stop:632 length:228 start_codon:yes stop_codon:yes gene_type:complete
MEYSLEIIKNNIDYIILDWTKKNILSANLNNDLEFYIYQLRQKTQNPVEEEYLDYKLNIWKNIEIKRNEIKTNNF